MDDDLIPLTEVPLELNRLTGQTPPGYRACYMAALDARVPTEIINRRRHVRRSKLPAIAVGFGMTLLEQVSATTPAAAA